MYVLVGIKMYNRTRKPSRKVSRKMRSRSDAPLICCCYIFYLNDINISFVYSIVPVHNLLTLPDEVTNDALECTNVILCSKGSMQLN